VLDFSKIEAGKIALDIADFSPQTAIDDVFQLFSAEADRKNLVLTSTIDKDVPWALRGDPVRLGQIFPGSGKTTELLFEVSDQGPGIAEEHFDTLFDHFSQVDESPTRQFGGTGLGLAICKELVGLMGGRIGVRSTAGVGSTFWFTVRLEKGDATVVTESTRDLEVLEETYATYSKHAVVAGRWTDIDKKVLVVDDNEVNLLVAQRMLEELGFEVDLAANGEEAIDAAASRAYAAILIDSQMPGMDGNEATSIIRQSEGDAKRTPIIALTANAMAPDREKAFAAGVDDYLSKPVFLEDLEAALSRALLCDDDGPLRIISSDLRLTDLSASPVFDSGMVEELRTISGTGDSDLFTELASQFLKQMPAWLGEMGSSASKGDIVSVRRQAHKLLGLCRQIGAQRMAQICDDLESIKSDAEGDDILRGVNLLRDEYESAHRILQDRYLS
jgi:CheY-like chemotaxis protein/HPt (histidine-containing phosphotransfer) domain-containing protein